MKVKEELSNDYKKDEEFSVKILKESDKYLLKEITYNLDIPYSVYYLYDKKQSNKCIITLGSPNPNKNSIAKDLFLKYQHGCKDFLEQYFDLLEEKISEFIGYHSKDKSYKLFTQPIYQDGFEYVVIANKKDEKITDVIGLVSLKTLNESEILAEKIIKYFENFKYMVIE